MLTQRQMNILMYLINANEWITSEMLSTSLDLNKKTIQSEIKEITHELQDEVELSISKHKGYRIEHISDDGLHTLLSELNRHELKNCLPPRQSTLILYFLYLKSYITMQGLADSFFMSKTAISLEVGVIKRWIDRYDGLALEVNNKKGILLHASEERKRIYCSKHGTLKAFKSLPFPEEIKLEYEHYLHATKTILTRNCIRFHFIITGEDVVKTTQFLSSCMLRSRMGYVRESCLQPIDLHDIVKSIKAEVLDELQYELSTIEMLDLQKILYESDVMSEHKDRKHAQVQKIHEFFQFVGKTVNLDLDVQNQKIYTMHNFIEKMAIREQNGNIAINHYNEDIVLRYPLEAYLAYRFFPSVFSMKVSKETSCIALFLASYLYPYKESLHVLLVSDQNASIVYSIKTLVQSLSLSMKLHTFDAIPVYQYEHDPKIRHSYDLLLTTDQKTVLTDPAFFLISPIISHDDFEYLQQYCQRRQLVAHKDERNEIRKKYVKHIRITKIEESEFSMLLKPQTNTAMSYHTFSEHLVYIGHVEKELTTAINILELEEAVMFLHKRIKRVIYVTFKEGDPILFSFFDAVSDVLHEYK